MFTSLQNSLISNVIETHAQCLEFPGDGTLPGTKSGKVSQRRQQCSYIFEGLVRVFQAAGGGKIVPKRRNVAHGLIDG